MSAKNEERFTEILTSHALEHMELGIRCRPENDQCWLITRVQELEADKEWAKNTMAKMSNMFTRDLRGVLHCAEKAEAEVEKLRAEVGAARRLLLGLVGDKP